MKLTKKFAAASALIIAAAAGLYACGGSDSVETPSVTVQTLQGPVQGVSTDNPAITNFKGIPYAAPPVGDLRWRAPQGYPIWSAVRLTDTFTPNCRQVAGTEGGFFDRIIEGHGLGAIKNTLIKKVVAGMPKPVQSEDCLGLNIRTGNLNTDGSVKAAKQPVMVWIHGGGHHFGSGDFSTYQHNSLAEKGVVLVTINYRLGVFGYMAHPALSADDPRGISGNYGLQDQIAALQWVKDNISSYGGDPDNVTIFGESAGAWSVTELMSAPKAKGLFHKAIGQSGASTYHLGDLRVNATDWPSGHGTGEAIVAKMGLPKAISAEALRALDADALLAAVAGDNELYDGLHPVRDGYVLPKNVGVAFRDGDINAVPVIFGYNEDEGTLFFDDDPQPSVWVEDFPRTGKAEQIAAFTPIYGAQNAAFLVEKFNLDTPDTFRLGGMDMMGDDIFGVNVRFAARQTAAAGQDAWLYTFSRIPPSKRQTIGAFHAAELPFVFGSHEPILGVTDEDRELTEIIQTYWTNFAKTGNPNGAGVDNWNDISTNTWMEFAGNTPRRTGPITNYNGQVLDALEPGLISHLEKVSPSDVR